MSADGVKDLFDEIRRENLAAHAELRRHMTATFARRNDELHEIVVSLRLLGEKIDRVFTSLGEDVERSEADTQALIKSLVDRQE